MPQQAPKSSRRDAERNRRVTAVATTLGVVLAVALVGALIWYWANQTAGVRRQVPKQDMIVPFPPPPPPEEQPEPEPEPEPEEQVEPEPVPEEPTPVEEPTPEEPPSPSQDLSEAMQIDGEAQAGNDAFNIGAGSGGGMGGSGAGAAGNATYGQYLSYAFQRKLRENRDIRHLSYRVEVNLWLDPDGRVTRVEMLSSSGDQDVDRRIVNALRDMDALDQKPPRSLTLPVRMSLQGRRPG